MPTVRNAHPARKALLTLLFLVSCGTSQEPPRSHEAQFVQPPPAALEAIRDELQQGVEDGKYPSVAVAVFDDGELVWRESFGRSNLEEDTAADPRTVYAVGSLSKSVTATAILTLVEAGHLQLDDSVEDLLGLQLRRTEAMLAPTVRDLIHMTAGVPHGHFSPAAGRAQPGRYVDLYAVQAFPAGEQFLYSNYSYGLLGHVAERVDGKPFEQIIQERVFDPLGMPTARADRLGTGPRDAVLYDREGEAIAPYEWHPVAGGGMSASLIDLEQYTLFHLGRHPNGSAVLSPRTLETMHTTFSQIESTLLALGIGSIEAPPRGRLLMTSGSIAGGRSASAMLPSLGDAAILLINSEGDTDDVELGTVRILEALNPGFLDSVMPAVEAQNRIHYGNYRGEPEFVGAWCGTFEATTGDPVEAQITFAEDGSASSSFRGSEPVRSEPGFARGRVFSTLFAGGERVRFNLIRWENRLLGSVVTTDRTADLTNDLPHVGSMAPCPTID